MKCVKCGKGISRFAGTYTYGVQNGKKVNVTCSACDKAKKDAWNAQIAELRCRTCGKANFANGVYSHGADGRVTSAQCTECSRAEERASLQAVATREHHVEILQQVWNAAANRPSLEVQDGSFMGVYGLDIEYELRPQGWVLGERKLTVRIQVQGDEVIGTYLDPKTIRALEIFRVGVSPTCAEEVVNLVQVFMTSHRT